MAAEAAKLDVALAASEEAKREAVRAVADQAAAFVAEAAGRVQAAEAERSSALEAALEADACFKATRAVANAEKLVLEQRLDDMEAVEAGLEVAVHENARALEVATMRADTFGEIAAQTSRELTGALVAVTEAEWLARSEAEAREVVVATKFEDEVTVAVKDVVARLNAAAEHAQQGTSQPTALARVEEEQPVGPAFKVSEVVSATKPVVVPATEVKHRSNLLQVVLVATLTALLASGKR